MQSASFAVSLQHRLKGLSALDVTCRREWTADRASRSHAVVILAQERAEQTAQDLKVLDRKENAWTR